MNLKLVHILQLILGGVTLAAQFVASNLPQYAALAHAASALAVALLSTLSVLSPSAASPVQVPSGQSESALQLSTQSVVDKLQASK